MKTLSVRLPDDLHSQLKTEAAEIGISLNALIVLRLRFQPEQDTPASDDAERHKSKRKRKR